MGDTEVYGLVVDENQDPSPNDLRTVSAAGLPAVQAKVDKLNRKAERLGLEARLRLEVIGHRWEAVPGVSNDPWDGIEGVTPLVEREVVDHRIVGDEIVLPGGWRFLAALDHQGPVNVLRTAPNLPEGTVVPEWARTVPPRCDHCKQDRRRNDTYLVFDADNQVVQVGSSCLVDFLGLTPAQAAWVFEDIESGGGGEGDGGGGEERLPLHYFLTITAAIIRTRGWVSRSVAREFEKVATADDVVAVFTARGAKKKEWAKEIVASITEADHKNADDAIAWVRSDDFDIDGDYGWNLRAVGGVDHVTSRNTGIAASLVYCWLRRTEQIAKRKARSVASTHVGRPGDKVALDLTVTATRTFDGDYGLRLLVSGVTPGGSEIVCWTSPSTGFGRWATEVCGDEKAHQIKATIKAHEEYKGVPQTVITRAKAL